MRSLEVGCMEILPPSIMDYDYSNEAAKKVPFLRLGLPYWTIEKPIGARVAVIHERGVSTKLMNRDLSIPDRNCNTKTKPK